MQSTDLLIDDYYNKTLSEDHLAEEFLYLSQNMGISFFPQRGIYDQMLSSGSIELIQAKELQMSLAMLYEHYAERNSAVNQAIDNFFTSTFENIYNEIVVFSEPSEENVIIYSGALVRSYDISETYYSSRRVPYFYSQSQTLIRYYSDLMESYASSFDDLKGKIKQELKKHI